MTNYRTVGKLTLSTLVLVLYLIPINGLSTTNGREGRKLFGGYRITPKFCKATKELPLDDPRSSGPKICMFNHECTQRNGEVVGACMDGFLFGACCQLPPSIDTPLEDADYDNASPGNAAAAISYESYVSQNDNKWRHPPRPTIIYNNLDHGNNALYNINDDQFTKISTQVLNNNYHNGYVSASPSPSTVHTVTKGDFYLPPSSTASQVYSDELPALIPTGPHNVEPQNNGYLSNGVNQITSSLLSHNPMFDEEFNHSDITHPGAETILLDDTTSGYQYEPIHQNGHKPTTEKVSKISYTATPIRTKPTKIQQNGDKFVLVQTITNNKNDPPSYTSTSAFPFNSISPNGIESIESIILQLNDSNPGPQYSTGGGGYYSQTPPYTSSTNGISNGPSSFYITSSLPSSTPSYTTTQFVQSSTVKRPPSKPVKVHSNVSPSTYGTVSPSTYGTVSPSTVSISSVNVPSSTIQPPSRKKPSTNSGTLITAASFKPTKPTKVVTQSSSTPQKNEVVITPTRQRPTSVPPKKTTAVRPGTSTVTRRPSTKQPVRVSSTQKPPSTSYVYSPSPTRRPTVTTNRVPSINLGGSSTPTVIVLDPFTNDYGISSTESSQYYGQNQIISSTLRPQSSVTPDGLYVPQSTVHITPKPTVGISTPSIWDGTKITAPPNPSSTSYLYSSILTNRPVILSSTPGYDDPPLYGQPDFKLPTEFEDPGYFGPVSTINPNQGQFTSADENFITSSNYPQQVDVSTQSNDINAFPPVRNPNLNVSNSIETATQSIIEDSILENKIEQLVSKIAESLVDKFDDLADIVKENNKTVTATTIINQNDEIEPITVTKPTRKPSTGTTKRPQRTTTVRNKVTTLKPVNTRPGSNKPSSTTKRPKPVATKTTKKPLRATTKKPVTTKTPRPPQRRPTTTVVPKRTTTKRIATRPTKRIPSTTAAPQEDEQDNEINEEEIDENLDEGEDSTPSFDGESKIQCGIRPHVKSGRIVGGKSAQFGEFPWQVLVRESTWLGLFTKNKCGGVLISNNYVLTAAHCQPGFLASLVAVFGEYDISGELESKRSVTKNVKSVVIHRQYDPATFENDLALLQLESPIHYDTHIVPICMPPDTADFTGRMATVSGWGRLKYNGGVPSVLQEVQVPIIENSVCQEMFHTAGHNKKILSSFLCAGYANGQRDSCEGDSGGPLVLQRPDGRYELAGTVSHGIKCAAPYLPGVYMRTTFYKPWLKSVTGVH